ncbi:MAG: LssY C-terminal domain-containing protein [Nitrospiraceae bacterium]|nr:MAG: LssY C-terminal domain-containing protein [Nitrospiraceae bacterium]
MVRARRRVHLSIVVFLMMLMGGCASTFERPAAFNDIALRERAETVAGDGIRVSAAIPGWEESRNIFGIDLDKEGIQPLWLEIENNTDRQIRFLPTGLDSEYFSPLEASFGFHKSFSDDFNARIDEHIEKLGFRYLINPHSTSSGFVFTNKDEVSKVVTVDLLGRKWSKAFTLFVPVPDRPIADDYYEGVVKMITSSDLVDVDDESRLRELLEQLPCCTSSNEGVQGEPLNIVVIGQLQDLLPAFGRRNFRYTSVVPQYLFQRPQDFSSRKRDRWVTAQPHVLRGWLTTIRFRGMPVWIGQVSTPLGGRFARETDDAAGVLIDPDVDEARNDLIQDLIYSQYLTKLGFVKGVGRVMVSNQRQTPSGGGYHTDGLRAVLIFEQRPVSLSQIGFFEWERLVDHYRQQLDSIESHETIRR